MKMRNSILFLLAGITSISFGQSLSPTVVALAGGLERTPSGMTLSWTLGEPVVDPLRSGIVFLTQGFQQPLLTVSTGFEDPGFSYAIEAFPNPTSFELKLKTEYHESINFRMVDMSGRAMREGVLQQRKTIDVANLPPGAYAIYFTAGGRMVRSELLSKH